MRIEKTNEEQTAHHARWLFCFADERHYLSRELACESSLCLCLCVCFCRSARQLVYIRHQLPVLPLPFRVVLLLVRAVQAERSVLARRRPGGSFRKTHKNGNQRPAKIAKACTSLGGGRRGKHSLRWNCRLSNTPVQDNNAGQKRIRLLSHLLDEVIAHWATGGNVDHLAGKTEGEESFKRSCKGERAVENPRPT